MLLVGFEDADVASLVGCDVDHFVEFHLLVGLVHCEHVFVGNGSVGHCANN